MNASNINLQPHPQPTFSSAHRHDWGPFHRSDLNVMANTHDLPFSCNTSINLCMRRRSYCLNKSTDVVASVQVVTIPSILGELRAGAAVWPCNNSLFEL